MLALSRVGNTTTTNIDDDKLSDTMTYVTLHMSDDVFRELGGFMNATGVSVAKG